VREHGFNVRPSDVSAFFEDCCHHALVFAHKSMISKSDISWGVKPFLDFLARFL
jgi:hypothetical protein